MDRSDFQQLAELRIKEAEALLDNGYYSGACYLAGYAVECGLKACIAKKIKQYEFPPKNTSGIYTHRLGELYISAGLRKFFDKEISKNNNFKNNWSYVKEWNEESRYELKTQKDAEDIINAISDPKEGILQWIKKYW